LVSCVVLQINNATILPAVPLNLCYICVKQVEKKEQLLLAQHINIYSSIRYTLAHIFNLRKSSGGKLFVLWVEWTPAIMICPRSTPTCFGNHYSRLVTTSNPSKPITAYFA